MTATLIEPSASAGHVVPIQVLDELEPLAHDWNLLAQNVPFRSWQWASSWWRHYSHDRAELFVLSVRDVQGRLIGLAPWYLERSARSGRAVRFLGTGEVCSDYLSVLCQPADAPTVTAALTDWLSRSAAQWDVLDLSAIDYADESLGHLRQQLADRGHAIDQRTEVRCWRLTFPETWDAYLATLSKSRRERTRSQLRKLVDTDRAVLHRADSHESVTRAFDILIELHQKRRGMLHQDGCFASPRFTAFHREVAQRMLATGSLRLSWLELEGRPIAADYSLVGGDTVYYYQGGFEPDVADSRPGWLMFALALRSALAEGYRHFDFLRGDEPYKASWQAEPRPLMQLRIAGCRPAARVRHAAWQTGESMKRWARSGWLARGRSKPAENTNT